MDGTTKVEYDAELPHLIGLVKQNWNGDSDPVIKITASGHGHGSYRVCTVAIDYIGATIV